VDDVYTHFVIAGDNQWSGYAWFFELDVAAFLASYPIPKFAENADDLVPP